MRTLLSDLVPATVYAVQIRSNSDTGSSEWSRGFTFTTLSDTVAPKTPINFAGAMSGTAFTYSWDKVTLSADNTLAFDLDHYEVKIDSSGSPNTATYITKDNKFELSFEMNVAAFAGPQANVECSVAAVDKAGNKSAFTSVISQTNPAPAAPASLVVTALLDSISTSWAANTTDADLAGYEVHVSSTGSAGTYTKKFSGRATSFIYPTISYGVDQWFRVYSVDVFGTLSTATQSASAARPLSAFGVDTTAPSVPAGLAAVLTTAADTTTSAAVSWTAVTDTDNDLASYIIGYRPVGATDWQYSTIDYSVITTKIDRLTPYVNYEFRIRSSDWAANLSAWSLTVTTTTAATDTAPSQPSAPTVASNTMQVQITQPFTKQAGGALEADVVSFDAYASTTSGFTTANANRLGNIPVGPATIGTFPLPASGGATTQTWYIKTKAIDRGGNQSASSNEVAATPGLIAGANIIDLTVTNAKIASVVADKITAGSGIIVDLDVHNTFTLGSASTTGVIKSFGYSAGVTGFSLSKTLLEINQGSIAAAALKIQQGKNLTPVQYAGFELASSFYPTALTPQSVNEVQTIGLGAATAGTVTITYSGQTTSAIAFDALASTVQTALEALTNIAPGDVVVTGGAFPATLTLSFAGALASLDLIQITATPTGLTGGTVTINTTVAGATGGFAKTIATTGAKYGVQCLQLRAQSAVVNEVYFGTSVTDYNINVEAGKTYIVSAWVKGGPVTSNFSFRVKYNDATSSALFGTTSITASAAYARQSATLLIPAGVSSMVLMFDCTTATTNAGWDVDGIQVEEQWGAITTPSVWTASTSTSADGGYIRTGEIRSNVTTSVNGVQQSTWVINMGGAAQFGDAVIRGKLLVGISGDPDIGASYIASGNYVAGTTGWKTDSAGNAEFSTGEFRGALVGATMSAGTITGTTMTGGIFQTSTAGNRFMADVQGARLYSQPDRTIGSTTIVAATGVFTVSVVHNLVIDNPVKLGTIVSTTGIEEGTTYYVKTVPSTTTLTLSATVGGTALVLTTDGSTATISTTDPEKLVINLPTDPLQDPYFAGELQATALAIADNLKINGISNQLATESVVTLGSGITAPTAAPTVVVDWTGYLIYTGSGIPDTGPRVRGFFYSAGYETLNMKEDGSVYYIKKYPLTYAPQGSPAQPNSVITLSLAVSGLRGLIKIGTNYWMVGPNSAAIPKVYKYNDAGVFQSSFNYANPGTAGKDIAIGTDGTDILIAGQTSTQTVIKRYNVSGTLLATYTAAFASGDFNIESVLVGTFDYGATRYLVQSKGSAGYTGWVTGFTLSGSTLTSTFSTEQFRAPPYGGCLGTVWDGTVFHTLQDATGGSNAYIYHLTPNKWTTESSTWWVGNAWHFKKQTIGLGAATAGTVTITFAGQTTSSIAFNAAPATIQTALEALSNIAPGDVVVTDGPFPAVVSIAWAGAYANSTPDAITATPTGLTGGAVTISAPFYKTVQSPQRSFTMTKRMGITTTSQVFPVTSSYSVDSTMTYMGRGATVPARTAMWNSTGATNSRVQRHESTAFSGTNPVATGTFPTATPGKIVSSAMQADGTTPKWTISGDGTISVDALSVKTSTASTGFVSFNQGNTANTGYINFVAPNGTRAGYIGFGSGAAPTADQGEIKYQALNHTFAGTITSANIYDTGWIALTLGASPFGTPQSVSSRCVNGNVTVTGLWIPTVGGTVPAAYTTIATLPTSCRPTTTSPRGLGYGSGGIPVEFLVNTNGTIQWRANSGAPTYSTSSSFSINGWTWRVD